MTKYPEAEVLVDDGPEFDKGPRKEKKKVVDPKAFVDIASTVDSATNIQVILDKLGEYQDCFTGENTEEGQEDIKLLKVINKIKAYQRNRTKDKLEAIPDPMGIGLRESIEKVLPPENNKEEGSKDPAEVVPPENIEAAAEALKEVGPDDERDFVPLGGDLRGLSEVVGKPVISELPSEVAAKMREGEQSNETVLAQEVKPAPESAEKPKPEGEKKPAKSAKPQAALTYQQFLKEKSKGSKPKNKEYDPYFHDKQNFGNLKQENGAAEMDAELGRWADDALAEKKGVKKPEQKAPTKEEVLSKPFPLQNRKQGEVLEKLSDAFQLESKTPGGEPEFVKGIIDKFKRRVKYIKQFNGIENVDLNKVPPQDHDAFLIKGDEEKYLNKLMHNQELSSVNDALYERRVRRTKNERPKGETYEAPKESFIMRWINRWIGKRDLEKKPKTYGRIKRSGGKKDGREEIEETDN